MTGRHLALSLLIVGAISGAGAWFFVARTDPDTLARRAEADLQAGRWDAAWVGVKRIERLRSPTPLDRMLRGRIASAAGRDSEALSELQEIRDDPELGAQALYLAGLIERRRQ